MSTFKTDIAALQSPTAPNDTNRAPGSKVTGDVFMLMATYLTLGTELATDFIEIGTAPRGSRVIPHLCKVVCEDPGTALIGTIGDAADPDRYATALDISAAGSYDFPSGADGALNPFLNTENTPILFDITTATSLVAAKKITFYLAMSAQN